MSSSSSSSSSTSASIKPHIPPLNLEKSEACFSNNWADANKLFLNTLKVFQQKFPSAESYSHQIWHRAPDGSALTIDAVYLPADGSVAKNLIIINSGIHGGEAPAGAASIIQLMRDLMVDPSQLAESSGLFLIHIMNPWGFAQRHTSEDGMQFGALRTTGERIDLNRNSAYITGAQTHYDPLPQEIDGMINPVVPLTNLGFAGKTIRVLVTGQSKDYKDAMLLGQYSNPNKCLFGGQKIAEETHVIINEWLTPLIQRYSSTSIIDLHTGLFSLNPYTILPVCGDLDKINEVFKGTVSNFADSLLVDPRTRNRTFVEGVAFRVQEYGRQLGIGLMLEFSVPNAEWGWGFAMKNQASLINIFKQTVEENRAYVYGTREEKSAASLEYQKIFDSPDPAWRARALDSARSFFKLVLEQH